MRKNVNTSNSGKLTLPVEGGLHGTNFWKDGHGPGFMWAQAVGHLTKDNEVVPAQAVWVKPAHRGSKPFDELAEVLVHPGDYICRAASMANFGPRVETLSITIDQIASVSKAEGETPASVELTPTFEVEIHVNNAGWKTLLHEAFHPLVEATLLMATTPFNKVAHFVKPPARKAAPKVALAAPDAPTFPPPAGFPAPTLEAAGFAAPTGPQLA